MSSRAAVTLMMVAGALSSCGDTATPSSTPASAAPAVIELPAPETGVMILEDALAGRRSRRSYTEEPLATEAISQLLWAAQGVTSPGGARTAPSAGGLYPLEMYVALGDGVFHYVPEGHRLERMTGDDVRGTLAEAGLGQSALEEAPAVFVMAAVYGRTASKYGDRAERYVELEAGHAAQNLLLQAVALHLAAVPIGAFHDDEVQVLLDLPADHDPLYLIPVGHPADG